MRTLQSELEAALMPKAEPAPRINLDSLSAFATNLLKDAAVWSRYWSEVLDCRDSAEVDELLLDYGFGQTWEY